MISCPQGLWSAGELLFKHSPLRLFMFHYLPQDFFYLLFRVSPFSFILTDVTVLSCPSRKAVTQVSTNQVATRAGMHAYIHFTLVGVYREKGEVSENTHYIISTVYERSKPVINRPQLH